MVFEAKWEPANIHLKSPVPNWCTKVSKVAYDLFSIVFFPLGFARLIGWSLSFLAKKIVLPSAWFYSHQIIRLQQNFFNAFFFGEVNPFNQRYRNHFTAEKHQVLTPDGALLDTTFFAHHQNAPDTRTILIFCSNSTFSQQAVYAWLMELAIAQGIICNFAVFDYRGVSNSEGNAKGTKDLLIDCDSIFQFLRDKKQIHPENIAIYANSLGGGLSAKIKEMRPELTGPYVNERSFSSLSAIFQAMTPILFKPLFFWIPKALDKLGWDLNTNPQKIQGPLLVIRHNDDPIIPKNASFATAARKAGAVFEFVDLRGEPALFAEENRRYVDHHFEPLNRYLVGQTETRADQFVSAFILPRPPAQVNVV